MKTPAIELLAVEISPEFTLGQVVMRKCHSGYELFHIADREGVPEKLDVVTLKGARDISQLNEHGAFRPLKSAPNLRSGWILRARDEEELEYALNQIYPGAVADWRAHRTKTGYITDFREFTNRQSGMYRITQSLSDQEAADTIAACCDARVCLKCRLWSVRSMEPDSTLDKSQIPCFEPCAVLLEFARTAARIQQEEKSELRFSASEIESARSALESQLGGPDRAGGNADIKQPGNPRRLLLLLRKLPPRKAATAD